MELSKNRRAAFVVVGLR